MSLVLVMGFVASFKVLLYRKSFNIFVYWLYISNFLLFLAITKNFSQFRGPSKRPEYFKWLTLSSLDLDILCLECDPTCLLKSGYLKWLTLSHLSLDISCLEYVPSCLSISLCCLLLSTWKKNSIKNNTKLSISPENMFA